LGLTQAVEYQGNAETTGVKTLTDNEATWTEGQFNSGYYVEIVSNPGGNASVVGTTYDVEATYSATPTGANPAKTLVLVQNLANGVSPGAVFKVRKHWTIASVFGVNNSSGLAGGTADTADQILVLNQQTKAYDTYYYQTSAAGTGWRSTASATNDASGTVLYSDEGIIINRKQQSPVSIVLTGAVKMGQTSVPVLTGTNVIGNVYAANMTLATSGLYTGDAATGLKGGGGSSADRVLVWNGTGYDVFFYQTAEVGSPGWRSGGDRVNDAGNTPIPLGSSFIIKRDGTPFDWKAPQHPTSL
jgi:uncharacterized protein (TIGR02597 family)